MASTTKMKLKVTNGEEIENDDDELTMNTEEFHVMHMEPRPFRPFKTSEEYLYAMKEDLAEWLKTLYSIDITVDNFFEQLETGVILCQHANSILKIAREFKSKQRKLDVNIPDREVVFRHDVHPGTFPARDNVSNFISWCRSLAIKECLLFETEDLVMRKNERSFILCLLEVARYGARFGMLAPILVQIEQEIDAEIENPEVGQGIEDTDYLGVSTVVAFQTHEQRMAQLMGLHERVVNLLNRCTCPSQFPMIKVADGKYRIGDKLIIFVRILRNHVMVRVGGGWDTLEHYLDKHDPCRCRSGHRFSTSARLTMTADKTGSHQMQVTYNRPAAVSDPPPPSPGLISHYLMENTVEKDCSSYPSRNHAQPPPVYNSLPKSRSRSFDTASLGDEIRHPVGPKRYSTSPKGTKKENSDPSSFTPINRNQSPSRRQSVETSSPTPGRKLPLVPSCPNRIPLQKSASKSKIPCLEPHSAKFSPKSQSTEDLYTGKYYLGTDDRWQHRSRSSNSSPVHGAPRSTSMEQCSLAMVGGRTPISRRSEDFSYQRPGQYSFRNARQSPELRRKSDKGNKTWAYHPRVQRPALHSDWCPPSPSSSRIPSPRLQSSQPARVSPKPRQTVSTPCDEEYDKSQALLKNVEMCIDQYQIRLDEHFKGGDHEDQNGYGNHSPTDPDTKSARSRPMKEGLTGTVSRIPILQWNK